MPYNAQQIPPIDFRPGRAVGVALPFNGPACFRSTFTTGEAIKANLIDYFLTNTGERPLNPTYGGNLRQYIFDQISTENLDGIKQDIQNKLAQNFPTVNVQRLDILSQPDYNIITVQIFYNVINTTISGELTLNL
jgi:phage baseplate assembly protein W